MRARVLLPIALLLVGCSEAATGGEIAASAEAAQPLAVGTLAPSASLRDVDGEPVQLDAIVGTGPVALVFYRGGW